MIAEVGSNPNFIAFMAHSGFAYAIVSVFPNPLTLGVGVAAAAVKEFWFDIRYEVNQTYEDGLLDWSGYAMGLFLGALKFGVIHLW